jgi:hypothetical protein
MSMKMGLCVAFLASATLVACAGNNPQQSRAYNDGYAAGCHTGNESLMNSEAPTAEPDRGRYMNEANFKAGWDRGHSLCHDRAEDGPGAG